MPAWVSKIIWTILEKFLYAMITQVVGWLLQEMKNLIKRVFDRRIAIIRQRKAKAKSDARRARNDSDEVAAARADAEAEAAGREERDISETLAALVEGIDKIVKEMPETVAQITHEAKSEVGRHKLLSSESKSALPPPTEHPRS